MTDVPQKRFEDHELNGFASISNSNERERRLAHELLGTRDALTRIRDLIRDWPATGDWKACAARVGDIAEIATLPED